MHARTDARAYTRFLGPTVYFQESRVALPNGGLLQCCAQTPLKPHPGSSYYQRNAT